MQIGSMTGNQAFLRKACLIIGSRRLYCLSGRGRNLPGTLSQGVVELLPSWLSMHVPKSSR